MSLAFTFQDQEFNIHKIIDSAGSTACMHGAPPIDLIDRLKQHIGDPDNYEDGEPRPDSETLTKIVRFVEDMRQLQVGLRTPRISTFYGEIDLTWENPLRTVRVIAYPGAKATQLYVLVKDEGSDSKSSIKPALPRDLADELALVYSYGTAPI